MYSRQSLLGLSIVVSLLVHAGLFAVAPMITVAGLSPMPQKAPQRFQVRIRTEPPPPEVEVPEEGEVKGPGSIEELLRQEAEEIDAIESLLNQTVDVPQLNDRLASENVERDHYLEPDPAILDKVDGKIIEISQETARQDIEIARRLVSPSNNRIVGENELPVLRGPGDTGEEPITVGSLPARSLLGETMDEPKERGAVEEPPPPPVEHEINEPPTEVLMPPVAVKQRVAPVVADIQEEAPFEFMDELLDVHVSAYFPPQEKSAFFRVDISPKTASDIPPLPKDVTFVIDASNSIVQHKLNQTARATNDMVQMLRPEDRFNIVVFRDGATSFKPEPVAATSRIKEEAEDFLDGLESHGGTNVYNAIRPVVQTPPRPGVPGVVVVMSDGRPTEGVKDARAIINGLTAENVLGNTIFAFGGGNTVNQYLLDLLAYRNKGESKVVPSIDDIRPGLPQFFSKLNDPLLVELQADFGSINKTEIFPKEIPDFYKNKAVTVYGRFDPGKDSEFFMRLTGEALGNQKEIIFKTDLRQAATGDDQIARNWAFQKIYHLIGEICRVGEKPELLAELHELSRKYNIRTSYD